MTGLLRRVTCFSRPAHNTDGSPPSRANELTTPPCAQSASSRNERYNDDFPDPFGPVTTVKRRRANRKSRNDR
ncbi:hypothetical protein GCM10022204_10670 [Microlunatus aurantiacus]|uniref:Uncharacterized protein n=1 Tax=Microlunatus aurantiacus TaxID=446786 RepID=A0ABP7CUI8_9ACTN